MVGWEGGFAVKWYFPIEVVKDAKRKTQSCFPNVLQRKSDSSFSPPQIPTPSHHHHPPP